jgi:hypothetical protein
MNSDYTKILTRSALELIRTGKDTIVSKYKSKLLLDQAQGNVAATLRAWKEEQK